MSSPEHKQLIWNLIEEIKFGMLVTNEDDKGTLTSRPMTLVQDEYDGTLYFFSSKHDTKAYEIKKDRHVCVTFSNTETKTYVSLSGTANLTTNPELVDKYWNKYIAAWYPEGKEDPSLAMIEIKIESGEHWKTDENMFAKLYEIAKATITDSKPDLGEHDTFGK